MAAAGGEAFGRCHAARNRAGAAFCRSQRGELWQSLSLRPVASAPQTKANTAFELLTSSDARQQNSRPLMTNMTHAERFLNDAQRPSPRFCGEDQTLRAFLFPERQRGWANDV